jgi:glycosyltransferase involved in cell wall biosynthesis
MNIPTVSVVMSVFNGESFLAEAVGSILDQSFPDFEFIIINDGSTDGTTAMIEAYQKRDPRLRVYHQENRGLIESLNRGCGLARGKYIARMDADDVAIKDRLLRQVCFLEEHPEVAAVGGAIETMDATGAPLGIERSPITDREIKSALVRGDCPFVHPTVLIRRDVFVSVHGYRRVVVDAEDYDLWARIADRFELANLEAVVLKYRRHPYQVSIRQCSRQALNALAAHTAALYRRDGNPDPLDSIGEITPAVLTRLGISNSTQETAICRGHVTCIRSMYTAHEYSEALKAIESVRLGEWKQADKAAITDLRFLVARLCWHQKSFVRAILIAVYALIRRPITLGRPFKLFLRRLRAVAAQ